MWVKLCGITIMVANYSLSSLLRFHSSISRTLYLALAADGLAVHIFYTRARGSHALRLPAFYNSHTRARGRRQAQGTTHNVHLRISAKQICGFESTISLSITFPLFRIDPLVILAAYICRTARHIAVWTCVCVWCRCWSDARLSRTISASTAQIWNMIELKLPKCPWIHGAILGFFSSIFRRSPGIPTHERVSMCRLSNVMPCACERQTRAWVTGVCWMLVLPSATKMTKNKIINTKSK